MAGNDGPEPSNWELFRGIARVEAAVSGLGGKVVAVEVYNADKDAQRAVNERLGGEVKELEQGLAQKIKDDVDRERQVEALSKSARLTLALAIFGPIAAFLLGLLSKGVGL